ncbi:MAG TPA: ABC transporter permease subunit [Fimbriiglobus sp.]|nr:ABC transporter permease subunit [Fimbriiglobus sp.]
MTLVLVRKLLRDVRWPLLAVCIILFAFSAFWVKIAQRVTTEIAPFFLIIGQAQGISPEVFDEVIFKGPGKISQAVMGGADVKFDRPNDFLAVELLHPVVVILASLWAVSRAASAISGEIDRGTMELLLSQPVPRGRLVLAHLTVDALVIPALCLSIVGGTQLGLWLVGPFEVDYSVLDKLPPRARLFVPKGEPVLSVSAARQGWAVLNLAGLAFAISGLSMAVSSVGRSRWRALGVAALAVVLMFVANVIGQLWDDAAFVRPATVFFYYQPQKVWLDATWTADLGAAWAGGKPLARVNVLAVLVAVGAAGYLVAWRVFSRRDLPAPL